MRHRKGFNHLGRTSAHRKAMLANMATSLILHKRITTTTAKAKALRSYVEPLITRSKDDSTHSRRVVFSYLKNKYAVSELFREISPKIAERPGGYTRILKLGNRLGDNADMCIIELVDYNENMLAGEGKKVKTTRRRRSGSKKKPEEGIPVAASESETSVVTETEAEGSTEITDTSESTESDMESKGTEASSSADKEKEKSAEVVDEEEILPGETETGATEEIPAETSMEATSDPVNNETEEDSADSTKDGSSESDSKEDKKD